ncbi:hypothetical protein [Flavimarina sp. Hel_I_48]|uniref:hypothetical protein n=1 Tax=Flavimarina sp. Hel_I_48 TaxID=1392488 RepID=UPI00068AA89F|nr:hypothetical protein [Flavimarina sp. Hel_I_48]
MKNLLFFFITVFTFTSQASMASVNHSDNPYSRYNGQRYLFNEGGIEFSVYPDGEFDFVVPQAVNNLQLNLNNSALNISYNTGFNYDAFVQYDTYGAVIQIADVPIYYDNWGRISQAGNIVINYVNNHIVRVGNLQVFYQGNAFAYTRGYINPYNRRIQYYAYTDYFYRPYVDRCLVYNAPYRRSYAPQRYSYAYHRNQYLHGFNDGYANAYRDFRRPEGVLAHNNARAGSYRDARVATSRSISQRSTPANTRVNRGSRNATSRVAPTSRMDRSSRSAASGVAPVSRNAQDSRNSRTAPQPRSNANYGNRTVNNTAARSSSTSNSNRISKSTSRSAPAISTRRTTASSKTNTQARSSNVARSSGNSRSSNRAASTTSSRASRSSSSRSGGK